MIGLGTFLDFMRGKWWLVPVAILGLLLVLAKADARHWEKRQKATQAAFDRTVADYRLAAEKARADDLAHAATIKARDDKIAQENQNALQVQLADARALAARYVERMRVVTSPNSSGGTGADRTAVTDPAGDPFAASGNAVVAVDDIRICTEAAVKAAGWRDWWARVSVLPR